MPDGMEVLTAEVAHLRQRIDEKFDTLHADFTQVCVALAKHDLRIQDLEIKQAEARAKYGVLTGLVGGINLLASAVAAFLGMRR
jgi:hypothetical protein